jgi:hypothetical protein
VLCKHGVRGSNPLTSTNIFCHLCVGSLICDLQPAPPADSGTPARASLHSRARTVRRVAPDRLSARQQGHRLESPHIHQRLPDSKRLKKFGLAGELHSSCTRVNPRLRQFDRAHSARKEAPSGGRKTAAYGPQSRLSGIPTKRLQDLPDCRTSRSGHTRVPKRGEDLSH